MQRNILIVDDDKNLRGTLQELLQGERYITREAANSREALDIIAVAAPDLILCDWKMPVAGGEWLLQETRDKSIPVIIMTAYGTGPNALKAMELGAYDFVTKPLDADLVLAAVERALLHADLGTHLEQIRSQRLRAELQADETDLGRAKLIGGSSAWLEVFKNIGKVAKTDVSVLLQGESGTGKEVVARTIHESSSRFQKAFVVVNCAALPAELIESELFGHERGSFTGAVAQKPGKFEIVAGGTIFLDEIGELPLSLQPKLLRVLQERSFERVGGTKTLQADFRLIAATNRDLADEVTEKTFRPDLYYRLQAYTLTLPALRERRSDILPLAEYFLRHFAASNGTKAPLLTDDAMLALQQYFFPGNVRELEHMMERAAVRAGGRAITPEMLLGPRQSAAAEPAAEPDYNGWQQLPFHESVAQWERLLITSALTVAKGNKSIAARRLGINRRLLYEKIQQLDIQ